MENFYKSVEASARKKIASYWDLKNGLNMNLNPCVNEKVLGTEMVLINLFAANFGCTLKIFFSSSSLKGLKELSNYSKDQIIDSVKELSNLLMADIKNLLVLNKIDCDVGIPVSLKGFDNLFVYESELRFHTLRCWNIDLEGCPIQFQLEIESLNTRIEEIVDGIVIFKSSDKSEVEIF